MDPSTYVKEEYGTSFEIKIKQEPQDPSGPFELALEGDVSKSALMEALDFKSTLDDDSSCLQGSRKMNSLESSLKFYEDETEQLNGRLESKRKAIIKAEKRHLKLIAEMEEIQDELDKKKENLLRIREGIKKKDGFIEQQSGRLTNLQREYIKQAQEFNAAKQVYHHEQFPETSVPSGSRQAQAGAQEFNATRQGYDQVYYDQQFPELSAASGSGQAQEHNAPRQVYNHQFPETSAPSGYW